MQKVNKITPLENYRLLLEFNNGELRIYDMSGKLTGVFEYLQNPEHFASVQLVRGAPTWYPPGSDMEIDLCPDALYMRSMPAEEVIL